MQINPSWQLAMLLCSFSWGYFSGLVLEGMLASHILLGLYLPPKFMHAAYARPLPLLRCCLPTPTQNKRRWVRGAVRAITQTLFCVVFAAGVILLLYYYNNGAIRWSVLLLSLLGLGAFRLTLARVLPYLTAYLAFFFALLRAYVLAVLRLPFLLLALLLHTLCLPLCRLWRHVRARVALRRSCVLCRRQLHLARQGLLGRSVTKIKEEKTYAKAKKDPHGVDHSHTRHFGVRRGTGDLRQPLDGVEQGQSRAGGLAGKRGE